MNTSDLLLIHKLALPVSPGTLSKATQDYRGVHDLLKAVPHEKLKVMNDAGKLKMFRHGQRDLAPALERAHVKAETFKGTERGDVYSSLEDTIKSKKNVVDLTK